MAQQNEGLFIAKDELQKLDEIIGSIPTKFGLPIVQFFQLVGQKRAEEAKAKVINEASKKAEDEETF